ncbi:MAG: UrcA family protein [Novosphingobium sp.]
MKLFYAAAFAASTLFAVAPVHAAPERVAVTLDRSDLATFAGRAAALRAVDRAAKTLCHVNETMLDHLQQWECHRKIMAQLIRDIGNPELLAQSRRTGAIRTALRN